MVMYAESLSRLTNILPGLGRKVCEAKKKARIIFGKI